MKLPNTNSTPPRRKPALANVISISTRNWPVKLAFIAAVLITAVACEEPKEIGLAPTTPVGVLYTDTLTITRTTIQLDSVRSNDQSTGLIGRYVDPVFGQIQAQAYMKLQPTSSLIVADSGTSNTTAASRIIVDSTKARLLINSVWYGDTTVSQTLVLSRLTDSLRTINYDISSPGPAIGAVVARRVVTPRPSLGDTATASSYIRVDNSIGRSVVAMANTDALRFTTSGTWVDPASFRRQIPQDFVVTTTSPPQAAVLGIPQSAVGFLIYYHVQGEQLVRTYGIPFVGKRFNQVIANRGGTALAGLRPGQSLAATTTGRTYVQAGAGTTTKLQFPSLTALLQTGRIAINRADLVVTPLAPDHGQRPLPDYLALSEVDANNRLVRSVTTAGVPSYLATVQAYGPASRLPTSYISPQLAGLDPRTGSYTFQIAGYLQSVAAKVSPNNGLAILTPSTTLFNASTYADETQAYLSNRVWRMVLDGKASVKLVLFYTKSN